MIIRRCVEHSNPELPRCDLGIQKRTQGHRSPIHPWETGEEMAFWEKRDSSSLRETV